MKIDKLPRWKFPSSKFFVFQKFSNFREIFAEISKNYKKVDTKQILYQDSEISESW